MTNARSARLIDLRRTDPRFNLAGWTALDEATRTLRNMADSVLMERYAMLDETLQWLLDDARDAEPIASGPFSSWWWLRAWRQTTAEMERRQIGVPSTAEAPRGFSLHPACLARRAACPVLWARVGQRDHLLGTLREGRILFSPARIYDDASMNDARRDDEYVRRRFRPGQETTVVSGGRMLSNPIGDVRYENSSSMPYWMSSWSTEVDLRLIDEFAQNDELVDSVIVVWDTAQFDDRLADVVTSQHSGWDYAAIPIRYDDPHAMEPVQRLPVSVTKEFGFAIQRELRLALKASRPDVENGFFVTMGSIQAIAGVYDASGRRLDGAGPETIVIP